MSRWWQAAQDPRNVGKLVAGPAKNQQVDLQKPGAELELKDDENCSLSAVEVSPCEAKLVLAIVLCVPVRDLGACVAII